MADAADMADAIQAEMIDIAVRQARNRILPGISGECDGCEWWMPRLVDGLCGFCRDGRPRPPDWEPPPRPDPVIVNDPPTELPAMHDTKSITLVATGAVLDKLKTMTADGTPYNRAALALLEHAVVEAAPAETQLPALAPWENPEATPRERMVELIDGMAALVVGLIEDVEVATAQADLTAEVTAAIARAEDAEREVARLSEVLALERERADAATGKLDSLRAALAA